MSEKKLYFELGIKTDKRENEILKEIINKLQDLEIIFLKFES